MRITNTVSEKSVTVTFVPGDFVRVSVTDGTTVLSMGTGKDYAPSRSALATLVRKAVRRARDERFESITFSSQSLAQLAPDLPETELGRLVAENASMAAYEFTRYKSVCEYAGLSEIALVGGSDNFNAGTKTGALVGEWVNTCRDLANTPGGDMTPSVLAQAAAEAVQGTSVKVTILEKSDVESLGMGLVLGVDQGSVEPLKFIVMEYGGGQSDQAPIVLIGKGITFDTGGINLKPSDAILGMNQDMSGGAAVIAAIAVVARLGLAKNIVALIPAVENAISGSAYRPGDVLRAMDGTTVEIGNTDAEGRLVLGDALVYARRYKPALVIDVATLTGAAIVALGKRASAVMTRDAELESQLRVLGEESGDRVWPLPLWKEYESDLKSDVADMNNIGTGAAARSAGSIQGGIFLAHFAKEFPRWAHLDIAPRMESIPDDNLAKGAAGVPVRLLVRLLESFT